MCTSPDCSCSTQLLLNVTSVLSFFLLFICSFSSLTLSLLPLFFTPFTFFLSVSFFLSYSFFILFFGCLHLSLPYPLLFHLSFFPSSYPFFYLFFFLSAFIFLSLSYPIHFFFFLSAFLFFTPLSIILFSFSSLPSPLSSPLSLHPPPPLSCLYTPLGPQFGLSSSSFLLSLSLFLSLFIYSFFFYYLSLIPYTLPLSSLFPICTP